jgi:SAM-dependent methyltransferase
MIKNYFLFLAFLINCTFLFGEKANEIWWEKNLQNNVSIETFHQWLGEWQTPDRIYLHSYLRETNYDTILDIPCGLCIDFWGLKNANIEMEYLGLDITQKLIDRAMNQGIPVMKASIENIPLEDSSFDITFSRHILEHLDDYQKAINELIRVAKKEVLISFFIKPNTLGKNIINSGMDRGCLLYHNCYDQKMMENFILRNPKVQSIKWKEIDLQSNLLHIYLKSTD